MKAITRYSLELATTAAELLELCPSEDLAGIPDGYVAAIEGVRYNKGSSQLTILLNCYPNPDAGRTVDDQDGPTRDDVDTAVDAQMAQLGADLKAAAAPLVDDDAPAPRQPRRRRS